jgi:DNA-binding PadR family transcriptional regulator
MSRSELTILVVLSHGEQYGREILKKATELGGVTLGGLYTTLNRMEEKGLVVGRWGDDSEAREGARRRYYSLTADGARVLSEARDLMKAARRLPLVLEA